MKRGYKYRIYPTDEQKQYIDLCIKGNVWFWNYALYKINDHYNNTKKHLSAKYNIAKDLPILKKEEKTSWLKQIDSTSFLYTADSLDTAYKRFFNKVSDKPKHKKYKYSGSFTVQVNKNYVDTSVNFQKGFIAVPKCGEVKTIFHRRFTGAPKRFTISKKSFDCYEVSILVDDNFVKPEKSKPTKEGTVGLDLGIKNNVILSDGTKYDTIKTNKLDKKIKRLQKRLSKKEWVKTGNKVFSKKYQKEVDEKIPSKNYIKLKDKIAKLYAKKERKRSYNNHQITSSIVNNDSYNTICVEDLNVKGMLKNHKIARAASNANMSEVVRQLEYKSEWHGKNLVKVGRFYASSQTCSCCGNRNKEVKNLNIRSWVCPVCGAKHDRDINAAINIREEGYRIITE